MCTQSPIICDAKIYSDDTNRFLFTYFLKDPHSSQNRKGGPHIGLLHLGANLGPVIDTESTAAVDHALGHSNDAGERGGQGTPGAEVDAQDQGVEGIEGPKRRRGGAHLTLVKKATKTTR